MTSRKKTDRPPTRVLAMVAMLAIVVGAIFSLILSNWIAGLAIGIAFAGGLYFTTVYQARRRPKSRRRR